MNTPLSKKTDEEIRAMLQTKKPTFVDKIKSKITKKAPPGGYIGQIVRKVDSNV
jgi:hypothetical protein